MRKVFYLFIVVLSLTACTQPTPPPQEDVLYQVEGFHESKPDSAMQILDTLTVSKLSEKERAHYCLLKARTNQLLLQFNAETDSLLQEAENYFSNSREHYFAAMTYWTMALEAGLTGQGNDAMLDYRMKGLQHIEKCKHIDRRLVEFSEKSDEQDIIDNLKYDLHFRIGLSYGDSHHYAECIEHLRMAERFFEEKAQYTKHFLTVYSMGHCYLKTHEYDSCLFYYEKGGLSAEMTDDMAIKAQYHQSIADYHLHRYRDRLYANDDEKTEWLHKAVSEDKQGLVALEASNNKHFQNMLKGLVFDDLAYAYFELHQYDSTIYYSQDHATNPNACYNLYKSYAALGDREKALEFAEKYMKLTDGKDERQRAFDEMKEEYDLQLQQQKLESAQQMKRLRLYLLIGLLVAALLLMWLSVSNYRKRKEMEVMRLHESQRKLQSEFDQVARHTREMLQQRVADIYQSNNKNRLQRILEVVDDTYPQAVARLKSAHPELGETDLNILLLNLLHFRIKEEADLLGLSENTVAKHRSNLKKILEKAPIPDWI